MRMQQTRRDFLRRSAHGGAALAVLAGAACATRPASFAPKSSASALRTVNRSEAGTLAVLGEALLPGSVAAGLVSYIDCQISGPPQDSMLMAKYLGVNAPFVDFYRSGLAAAEAAAVREFGSPVTSLSALEARTLIGHMATGGVPHWQGPPSGLFYFVLRSDAVDVTYGTIAGFDRLGVPYMAHITPPTRWGE